MSVDHSPRSKYILVLNFFPFIPRFILHSLLINKKIPTVNTTPCAICRDDYTIYLLKGKIAQNVFRSEQKIACVEIIFYEKKYYLDRKKTMFR